MNAPLKVLNRFLSPSDKAFAEGSQLLCVGSSVVAFLGKPGNNLICERRGILRHELQRCEGSVTTEVSREQGLKARQHTVHESGKDFCLQIFGDLRRQDCICLCPKFLSQSWVVCFDC